MLVRKKISTNKFSLFTHLANRDSNTNSNHRRHKSSCHRNRRSRMGAERIVHSWLLPPFI